MSNQAFPFRKMKLKSMCSLQQNGKGAKGISPGSEPAGLPCDNSHHQQTINIFSSHSPGSCFSLHFHHASVAGYNTWNGRHL
jgi:hypothetical protein